MKTVFVSGCYDILHAGHIQFFEEAKALGDRLVVCFASKDVLWEHKQRMPSLPDEHKKALLEALWMVDEVVIGEDKDLGLDFKSHIMRIRPDILAVTEDDQYPGLKDNLCMDLGIKYVVLPKTPPKFKPTSTSEIVRYIRAPKEAPLRVDFAGGWLDVPKYAKQGSYVVNCSISPTVSLNKWDYKTQSGLGGSGAWALLNGLNGVDEELDLGVGWQDPAIISETGLCAWKSGERPVLEIKRSGEILRGRLALYWTGKPHDTPNIANKKRPYDIIQSASEWAHNAVCNDNIFQLAQAVKLSYKAQLIEGMDMLPDFDGVMAKKYCGGGWGGYALYLFLNSEFRNKSKLKRIEPWINKY